MLKIIEHEKISALEWFSRRELIDFKPVYQRKSGLWNRDRQSLLIDTMLRGYDIPKLYLADFRSIPSELNVDNLPYAVIDGKQRLESIFAFFKNELRLVDKVVNLDESPLGVAELDYSALRLFEPRLASLIENFKLTVMSVTSENEYLIHDLFVRLNYGESLMAAEKRNAMAGRVPVYIRHIASHELFGEYIPFGTQRMEEFNIAAKLLHIEFAGKFRDVKAKDLDSFVGSWIPSEDDKYLRARDTVLIHLDDMSRSAIIKDKALKRSGDIPVIYWLFREGINKKVDVFAYLRYFFEKLSENQKLIRDDLPGTNDLLTRYYSRGRTTNDQGSLEDRYEMLLSAILQDRQF